MAKLDQAITMTLGGGIDKTLTIEAGKLPLMPTTLSMPKLKSLPVVATVTLT